MEQQKISPLYKDGVFKLSDMEAKVKKVENMLTKISTKPKT
jgi:hypothetical protein